jgi:hypothetical protein
MAKTKTIRVTEEELAALQMLRDGVKATDAKASTSSAAHRELADAFVEAIERTKPPAKITIANRKPKTPWTPPEGTPRTKMKRKFYHHGMLMDEKVSNEEIELLNQVRPGHYCDGYVRVTLRKDRGIDVDYPVRTASQRLRLINQYGIRSFKELLQRLIDEKNNPTKYRKPEDAELYDFD